MIMMVMTVKRVDEKTATVFHVLGQERKKTQEYMRRNQQQPFGETNMMMNSLNQVRKEGAENSDKLFSFMADCNRFTLQKMEDIADDHSFKFSKVIDRLIRVKYKQERREVRALYLEKRLRRRKRYRTSSMSSDAKREILQKRQDRREAPGTPTESEVMNVLESPRPEELYYPEGDGRVVPHEEDISSMEEQDGDTTQEKPASSPKPVEPPGGMSQEQWGRLKSKEKDYP